MTSRGSMAEKPTHDPGSPSPTPSLENGPASNDDHKDFGPAPDGGTQAWLVACGAAFFIFCAMGFMNTLGVFQEYYMSGPLSHESPDKVSWILSLCGFLQMASGAIGGPLFDRYGAKVLRPAAVLYIFSMMMLSLCKEYYQLMLAQGVLMGLTMGMMSFPAIAAVSQFFDKKRAAALGLTISGSSVGGVVLPIAVSRMIHNPSLGFGWAVRIIGFIMLPLLAFAIVTVKARLPPKTSKFFLIEAWKRWDYVLLVAAFFFMLMGMMPPMFYLPAYAVHRGMGPNLASYMLAILNGASTFGRVIPGIMADKWGRFNMFAIAGLINGIVIFCMNQAKTTAAIVVYSVVFGFTSGMIISGGGAALTVCPKDPREIGTYMGMGVGVASLAVLVGPPINGVLVDTYGGFFEVSMFCGAMCLVGGLVAIGSKAATEVGIWGRI